MSPWNLFPIEQKRSFFAVFFANHKIICNIAHDFGKGSRDDALAYYFALNQRSLENSFRNSRIKSEGKSIFGILCHLRLAMHTPWRGAFLLDDRGSISRLAPQV